MRPPAVAGSDGSESLPVVIIGAGPAGLALAFELRRRRVNFLVLEKGASAGDSWAKMPSRMKLASPWKANFLPGTDPRLHSANSEMSRSEYLDYLLNYARRSDLPIRTHTKVQSVSKTAEGDFLLQTSSGPLSAKALVNATGYFANSSVPNIPGMTDSTIPRLHFADYSDPDTLRSLTDKPNPLVLIVGKRLSAGQLIVELYEAGFHLAISHRSPIQYGPGPVMWWLFFRIFPQLERFKLRLNGSRATGWDVRMPGGTARKLIKSGRVPTFPVISRFAGNSVLFEDNRRLQPDVVLFATGFRPALGHLASLNVSTSPENGTPRLHDLESVSVSGLYFLGLDCGRNFQSRFIRGIRNDARFLAERLEKRFLPATRT
jgi:putative flavoprotein involved in K+ transport